MSMFSRRHYEAISEMIRNAKYIAQPDEQAGIDLVISELIDLFEKDNPNFDIGRFERACKNK